MNILERFRAEWESENKPKTDICTPEEIEKNTISAHVWAARIEKDIGRKVSQREIEDIMMF